MGGQRVRVSGRGQQCRVSPISTLTRYDYVLTCTHLSALLPDGLVQRQEVIFPYSIS